MPITTLFFDLDDTLYPNTSGLWDAIKDRITLYMRQRMHFSEAEISHLRNTYYTTYGTTLRGLQKHHAVDTDDFLAFVHDLSFADYLTPDPNLRSLLLNLPQQRWIFTNADRGHAERVLSFLQLSGCFHGIIDIRALQFACKPEPEAYRAAARLAGESDPTRCLMMDDSPHNLAPASQLGWTTVLVGTTQPHPAAHHAIGSVLDLPQVIPQLISALPGEQTHGF